MSRMVDRMLTHGFTPPYWTHPTAFEDFLEYQQEVLTTLEGAAVFSADHVARYYFEHVTSESWDLRQALSNLTPPCPCFFIEMRSPRQILSKENDGTRLVPVRFDFDGWGVLFEAMDLAAPENHLNSPQHLADLRAAAADAIQRHGRTLAAKFARYGAEFASHLNPTEKLASAWIEAQASVDRGERLPDIDPECKWLITMRLFVERRRYEIIGPIVIWQLLLNTAGLFQAPLPAYRTDARKSARRNQQAFDECIQNWQKLFGPALLALACLNSKNVKLTRETPPLASSRAFQRKHGRPLVPFHTLDLAPPRPGPEYEGKFA